MNSKQKLTLGIATIFMITLTIVGISYAYFVTRVVRNSPTTNIEIITAQYGVNYGDGNNIISLNNALPGYVIYKMFTVTNPEKVESKYTVQLTQIPGNIEFMHFDEVQNGATCYREDITKEANSSLCYEGEHYNNIKVKLVEYTGSNLNLKTLLSDLESNHQTELKQAFEEAEKNSGQGKVIEDEVSLTAKTGDDGKQNLGELQTIPGKTSDSDEDVVKYYILKVEYKDSGKNQNAETTAQVDIKVDLV